MAENEHLVRSTIIEINKERFSLNPNRDGVIDRQFSQTQAAVNTTADVRIAFHLMRSGEVYFSEPSFMDQELDYASVQYATQWGHDFAKWVADQSYFFLRDISHAHQHHERSSDTILVLQRRDVEDVDWRRRIIFSLYHQVIRSKRYGDASSAYRALGIQAYCMSFKAICKLQMGWKHSSFPVFNDLALTQSLQARAEEEMARYAHNSGEVGMQLARAANWRTFALALVAIVIAIAAMLLQPRINSNESDRFRELNAWSDFAALHFKTIFGMCVVILVVVWVKTHSGWAAKLQIARDLLEVSNVRRRLFIAVYFSLGIVAAVCTYWLAHPVLRDAWSAISDFWYLVR